MAKRNLGEAKSKTMHLSLGLDWGQPRAFLVLVLCLLACWPVAPPCCLLYSKLLPHLSPNSVKY